MNIVGNVTITVHSADGVHKVTRHAKNQVLYSGINLILETLNNQNTGWYPNLNIALGTDATPADPTQVSLLAPVASQAATMVASAVNIQPYTVAAGAKAGQSTTAIDTFTFSTQFIMTVAATLCEEAITPANSYFNALARQVISPAITVAANDIVTVTHSITFGL